MLAQSTTIPAKALNDRILAHITHQTEPLKLVTLGNNKETLAIFTHQSPSTRLILGFLWLKV